MIKIILIAVLLFVFYILGYATGRKEVVDEIRSITKELKEHIEHAD